MERTPAKKAKSESRSDRPKRSLGFWCIVGIAVLILIYLAVLEASRPHVSGQRLRLDSFNKLLAEDSLRDATILDQDRFIVGTYTAADGSVKRFNLPFSRNQNLAQDNLNRVLLDAKVPTRVDQQLLKRVVGPATTLLPALILTIVFLYFILSVRGGDGLFGRSGTSARVEDVGVTFNDVAGQEGAVTELRRRARGKSLAAIGFCFGGGMVWRLLAAGEKRLDAAAPFYGPFPEGGNLRKSRAAVLGVYGGLDDRVNATRDDATAALEAARLKYRILTFSEANHAFFNDTGERFNAPAAEEAWRRVISWFGKQAG